VDWVGCQREGMLEAHLLHDVHLVEFSPPHITFRLSEKAPKTLPKQIQDLLKTKLGDLWTIAISDEIGQPTLHEKAKQVLEDRRQLILEAPLVKAVMEAFPGATFIHKEDH